MASTSDSVPSFTAVGYTRTDATSPPNNHHLSSLSHVTLITVTVLAVAVTVSLALYFLLRYRNSNRFRFLRRVSPSTSAAAFSSSGNRILPETTSSSSVFDLLPTFTFSSITRRADAAGGGDCAVCLSKFEQNDLLRLLPLCCHAFHAECIDTWLRSKLTCPLCRSTVAASESDLAMVFRSSSVAGSDSFRLEIGNISSRREGDITAVAGETRGRSYSVGAFEYLIDEEAEVEVEVAFGLADRRIVSGEKNDGAPVVAPADSLAGEVGRGGGSRNGNGWLKDYVDRLSNTVSFRSSGSFFTGSSRRSDVVLGGDYDVEASRFGDEIGEMFRWLSGVWSVNKRNS